MSVGGINVSGGVAGVAGSGGGNEFSGGGEGGGQTSGVFAGPAGGFGAATAFAADMRDDSLNDFSGGDFFGVIRTSHCDQRNGAAGNTTENNDSGEAGFEGIGYGLQRVAIGITKICDDGGHSVDGLRLGNEFGRRGRSFALAGGLEGFFKFLLLGKDGFEFFFHIGHG